MLQRPKVRINNQPLLSYFAISIAISSLHISMFKQDLVVQLLKIIVCILGIASVLMDRCLTFIVPMNKIILLLCGLLSNQKEAILQYTLDQELLRRVDGFEDSVVFQCFNGLGLIALVGVQYYHDNQIQTTLLLPFLIICPQLWTFVFRCCYKPQLQTDQQLQLPNKEYREIKSSREQHEQDDIQVFNSHDFNKLLTKIAFNKDSEFAAQEIKIFQEQVWRQRMNAMPIGIAIIKHDQSVKFMNTTLINILRKNFQTNIGEMNVLLMDGLTFKRIENGSVGMANEWIQTSKRKSMNPSLMEEDNLTMRRVLTKLDDGTLQNQNDGIFELFSTFESQVNGRQIYLDCRVIYQEKSSWDHMIVIQDFTKQNELSNIQEQNEFKTKVIQSFSHELRTPLNSAMLFLQGALGDATVKEYIQQTYLQPCLTALKLQNHLINDIIDFSQINAGLLEIKYNTFTIQQLVDELTEQFKFEFILKQIGLAFDIDESIPIKIKTDYQRLMQVITNVVQNALKFTETGYIFIKLHSPSANEIVFSIQDEGIGLSVQEQITIQSLINNEQGRIKQKWKGFGLIICQMLLRYLGPITNSDIRISSPGLDAGTQVSFTITNYLPNNFDQISSTTRKKYRQLSMPILRNQYGLLINIKARSPSKLILHRTSQDDHIEESLGSLKKPSLEFHIRRYQMKKNTIEQLNQKSSNIISTRETGLVSNVFCCNQILSADDEVFNQRSLQMLLDQIGLKVDIVFNGKQALDRVQNPKKCNRNCSGYKMILMDCQMPILDGWQTSIKIIELMNNKEIPRIPIIGLTAFTSNDDIARCMASGMSEVLHKPLQIKQFQNVLLKYKII